MAVADVLETTIRTRAVFVGGGLGGLNPPQKFLTPLLAAAAIKKTQGGSTFYVLRH